MEDIKHDLSKAPLISNQTQISEKFNINGLSIDLNETIKTINWSMQSIYRLIEDKSRFDLVFEIKGFLSKLPPQIETQCKVESHYPIDQAYIYMHGNPEQIRSIVKNALYNSSAAMIKAGIKNPKVIVSLIINEEKSVVIEIEDNGRGIPRRIISKLYRTNERLSENPQGGMGSVIVNSFLKLNEGDVTIENKRNGRTGAIVRFYFACESNEI
jgi:nitrogen fixation/metabolism regulation signal transduction histidine kinase